MLVGDKAWGMRTLKNGQAPVAFIISANISRRHLSKGRQAMVVVNARLFSNRSMREAAETANVSKARVVQALLVLEYASDLADGVLSGAKPLNEAYEEAQRWKAEAESEEWVIRFGFG